MGRNFVDPILLDDCPTIVETRESLAGASLTSKFQTTTMFPGVSSAVLDVYVEYVPRPVPRAPRSVEKGDMQIVLLLVCLLPRSLASRVLVQVLKL